MKKIYLSKGFVFASKDLAILSTNNKEVVGLDVEDPIEVIPAKIHVDVMGSGDDVECLIQVTTTNFLDVTDISEYYPVVEFTTKTDDENCDIEYSQQETEVVDDVNMGSECNFEFEDLSIELQLRVIKEINRTLN